MNNTSQYIIPLETLVDCVKKDSYLYYTLSNKVYSKTIGDFVAVRKGAVVVSSSRPGSRVTINLKRLEALVAAVDDPVLKINKLEKEVEHLKRLLAKANEKDSVLDPKVGIYTAMIKGFETHRLAELYESAFSVIVELSRQPGSSSTGQWFTTLPAPGFTDKEHLERALSSVGANRVWEASEILAGRRS